MRTNDDESERPRYVAPRPASIFETTAIGARPHSTEAPISEQSLDEVILNYLAEDLRDDVESEK